MVIMLAIILRICFSLGCDNDGLLWKSLVMKHHFLVCIYALGDVTGTLMLVYAA